MVLFALGHYYEKERDLEFIESLYRPFIRKAADFLLFYRDLATKLPLESYDLWEERRGGFTFTAAAVYAGLMAAGKFARLFGHTQIAHQYEQAAKEMRRAMLRHLFDPGLGRFIRGSLPGWGPTCPRPYPGKQSLWPIWPWRFFR